MVDVLIITALHDEWKALKAVDEGAVAAWKTKQDSFGYRYYQRGYAIKDGGVLQVAAVPAEDMGGDATIEAALRTIPELQPACLAMCGICAGRRGDCALGDVIVADKVFRYDVGKVKHELDANGRKLTRFFTDTDTYKVKGQWKQPIRDAAEDWQPPLDRPLSLAVQGNWLLDQLARENDPWKHPEVKARVPSRKETLAYLRRKKLIGKSRLKILANGKRHIEQVVSDHGDELPDDPPFQVHLAPIASGSQVVQEDTIFHRIITLVRKTLGLEMEAAAIGRVAAMVKIPNMLIAKGVSDHADEDKDDSFRHFAARASAEFLLHFLRQTLTPKETTTPKRGRGTASRSKDSGSGEPGDPDKNPRPNRLTPNCGKRLLPSWWATFPKAIGNRCLPESGRSLKVTTALAMQTGWRHC